MKNIHLKSSENKFKGLNEFRLGFGATGYEYAGDFELVTNRFFYFMYQTLSPILKKFKNKKKKKKKVSEKTNEDTNESSEKKPSLLSLLLNRKKNDD